MMRSKKNNYAGFRFVIEGNDGTGKSTQADMLLWQFRMNGFKTIRVDEPDSARDERGATLVDVSEALRTLVKDGESYTSNWVADLAMYNVSRFANWNLATLPLLMSGGATGQARDYTSSLVYQGAGEGVDIATIEERTKELMQDERYFQPEYKTILVFKDESARKRRLAKRGDVQEAKDKFEQRDDSFQQRVNDTYRTIAERDNLTITWIEESESREQIADRIFADLIATTGVKLRKFPWSDYDQDLK